MAFNSDYNTNNSYNVHNAKPLINREQNYVIDRKLVSVHSIDRDITKYPNPNVFSINLPQPIVNVQSLRLVQSTFPVNYYTFSVNYENTQFHFTYRDIDYCATIQEGTYTPCQLATELTNVMNDWTKSDTFSVYYDPVGNQLWFGNTTHRFTLDFNYKINYGPPEHIVPTQCNTSIRWFQYAYWGLPYYIGYNKKQYLATEDPILIPKFNYLQPTPGGIPIKYVVVPDKERVVDIGGERDIYMEVDKYNSYDELYPYTESGRDFYSNNAYTGKVNSAFAKIPIDLATSQNSRNLLLLNYVQYEPPIERIARLDFRFRFHDGRLVDFRGLEFNFTLEFNSLRPEILRTKNIRVPAMLSL
jgi:hypothetical protein